MNAHFKVNNGVIVLSKSKSLVSFYMVSISIITLFTFGLDREVKALESNDFLDVEYPYVASKMEIGEVMSEFAQRTLLPVNVSGALSGAIDIRNAGGTIGSFLNQIAAKSQAVWWHDGVVLHIEPANSISNSYIDVENVSSDRLQQQISEVGLSWEAFPIRFSSDGSIARVAGPETYVSQVTEVVERLVEMQRNRPKRVRQSMQPRIYLGGRIVTSQNDNAAPVAQEN